MDSYIKDGMLAAKCWGASTTSPDKIPVPPKKTTAFTLINHFPYSKSASLLDPSLEQGLNGISEESKTLFVALEAEDRWRDYRSRKFTYVKRKFQEREISSTIALVFMILYRDSFHSSDLYCVITVPYSLFGCGSTCSFFGGKNHPDLWMSFPGS